MPGKGGKQSDRVQQPDPEGGPFAELAIGLYELYEAAGRPSTRELASIGKLSPASVKKILEGSGRWRWDTGRRMIRVGLRGDVEYWEQRWQEAAAAQDAIEANNGIVPLPWVSEDDQDDAADRRVVDDWRVRRAQFRLRFRPRGRRRGRRWEQRTSFRQHRVMLQTVRIHAEQVLERARTGLLLSPTFRGHQEGTTVRELFASAGENLLLLSGPGLGKTTQLSQLAYDLAGEALEELARPVRPEGERLPAIPLVLSLATYQGQALEDWIAEAVNRAYHVHTELARAWLVADQLLPLLDSLDEVPEQHRRECAKQIRRFREGCSGLVLTCRDRDLHLAATIGATRQVEIDRPSRRQVQDYLASNAEALEDVRAALDADASLWGLLRSPLMLNIIFHTYSDRKATELRQPGTTEQRRSRIFDAYLRRMLRYRPSRYPPDRTVRHLTWIARTLTKHNESVLYLDRMDHRWAGEEFAFLTAGVPRHATMFAALGGALAWLALWHQALPRLNLTAAALATLFFVAITLTRYRTLRLYTLAVSGISLLEASNTGSIISIALVITLFNWTANDANMRNLHQWNPVEEVRWSWRAPSRPQSADRLGRRWPSWTLRAIDIVLTLLLVGSVLSMFVPEHRAMSWPVLLCVVLITGLHELDRDRLQPSLRERRALPNEGIRRSVRIGVATGLLTLVSMGILTGLIATWILSTQVDLESALAIGGTFGVIFGIARGFRLGGSAVFTHWAIRLILARQGVLPMRLLGFLNSAEQQILMYRAGSGFTFPHRLIQDHLNVPCEELLPRLQTQQHETSSAPPAPGAA